MLSCDFSFLYHSYLMFSGTFSFPPLILYTLFFFSWGGYRSLYACLLVCLDRGDLGGGMKAVAVV